MKKICTIPDHCQFFFFFGVTLCTGQVPGTDFLTVLKPLVMWGRWRIDLKIWKDLNDPLKTADDRKVAQILCGDCCQGRGARGKTQLKDYYAHFKSSYKHKRGGHMVPLHTMEFIQPHLLWLDLAVERRKLLRHATQTKKKLLVCFIFLHLLSPYENNVCPLQDRSTNQRIKGG